MDGQKFRLLLHILDQKQYVIQRYGELIDETAENVKRADEEEEKIR